MVVAAARELVTSSSSASCRFRSKSLRVGEAVQHRGHPPGEPLRPPDPAQRGRRVGVEQVGGVRAVEGADGPGEHVDVGGGEVQPLGAGRRHRMRGVAGQEQPAVLHRLADEAAQAG